MKSEGVLVASKRALEMRPGLLEVVHELIERFEAHLTAEDFYSVTANMVRGPRFCSTLFDDNPVLNTWVCAAAGGPASTSRPGQAGRSAPCLLTHCIRGVLVH